MTYSPDQLRKASLIFAIGLGMASCDSQPVIADPIEKARAELRQGDAIQAEYLLTRQLERGASRESVAALLGEAALARGNFEEAREWLAPGLFSQDSIGRGYHMLGRLELVEGNLAAAGTAFDRAMATGMQEAELWVDIARLRYRGGEHTQAVDAVERAMALDRNNASALKFRGQLIRDAQGLVSAIEWFGRALEAQPDDLDLRTEYAATLGDAGRAREALEVLRYGDGKAASSPKGLFLQAVIAARGDNLRLARNLLERLGDVQEDVPAAKLLTAITDLQLENFSSAVRHLNDMYARQPDNNRIAELFAFALLRSGMEQQVIDHFDAQASLPTASNYLRTVVARAHEATGQRDRAAMLLDSSSNNTSALGALPPTELSDEALPSDQRSGLLARNEIRTLISNGRASGAARRARDFAIQNPGSGDAQAILGDAEYAAGDIAKAQQAYRRAIDIRQSWPLLVRMMRSQTDTADVQMLLESYLFEHPMSADAAVWLADSYASSGDWRRAATLLDRAMRLGYARVPDILAARSLAAANLGNPRSALDFAITAHELQPTNPVAIRALISALPGSENEVREELKAKLRSISSG